MRNLKRFCSLLAALLLLVCSVAVRETQAHGEIIRRTFGRLDPSDTITMPIKVYDFNNDGMLFDFASAGVVSPKLSYEGKTYNLGNNHAYGFYDASAVAPENPNYYLLPSISDYSDSDSIVRGDNSTQGLVQPTLEASGKPTYTQSAVEYLALLLHTTLPIPKTEPDGCYNYNFVEGAKNAELFGYTADGEERDFAQYLRDTLGSDYALGSYQDSVQKPLTSVAEIESCTDAALFMLNNLYTTAYSKEVSQYDNLKLTRETDRFGNHKYVFDSAYEGVVYDYSNGSIYTDATIARADYMLMWNDLIAANFFLPISSEISGEYYGDTISPYVLDQGVSDYDGNNIEYPIGSGQFNDTYSGRDYNYTMEGHAQFLYFEDKDLYFRFTGDDGVYIFINGVLALDIGGAHSIASGEMKLNDLAEQCQLVDGEAFTFDFYYTERHGFGANLRIETNIELYDPNVFMPQTGAQAHIEHRSYDEAGLYTNGIRFKVDLRVDSLQDALNVGDYFACGTLIQPLNRLNAPLDSPYQAEIMRLEVDASTGEYSSTNSAPIVTQPRVVQNGRFATDTMIEWTEQMEQAQNAEELIPLLREAGMTVFGKNEDDTAVRYVVYLTFSDNGTMDDAVRRAQADREIAFRGFFVRFCSNEGFSVCFTWQRANSATRIFNHYNYLNYGVLNDQLTPEAVQNGRSLLAPFEQLDSLGWEVIA